MFGLAVDGYPEWRERHGIATLHYL
jgi:hypothetical protein